MCVLGPLVVTVDNSIFLNGSHSAFYGNQNYFHISVSIYRHAVLIASPYTTDHSHVDGQTMSSGLA